MKELRRYFSYIGKYKYRYWTVFGITIISSVAMNVLYPYMNKMIFNSVEYGDKNLFVKAAVLCVFLVILRCLSPYLRYFQIRIVRKIVFDIKIRMFDKLMKMDMNYYEKNHSGDALKTLNWDANSLKDSYFSHVYWVCGRMINGLSSIIAMLVYSPALAAVSVCFCVITVFVSININQRIKKMDKDIQGSISRLAQKLSDILSGFTLIKMYSGSSIVIEVFQNENEDVRCQERRRVNKAALLEMVSFLLGILANFGTIVVGAYFVTQGKIDYGTVMAVVSLQMAVSTMVQRFGSAVATFSSSLVKAGRVFDFLELDGEEKDSFEEKAADVEGIASDNVKENTSDNVKENASDNVKENASDNLENGWSDGENSKISGKASIVINELCFDYEESHVILKNFNMCVRDGEKILLMGESGCGKSTLLKLMMRFYEKPSGKLVIFGRDISEYPIRQLREIITYIPQNSYLFAGTIRENIAFGDNNGKIVSDEDIIRASKMAYADEFIGRLPDGYDTVIDAGGSNLSGGQRQRIAIARAFLKNSPILLMDEPSSALDVQSEKMINQAMKELMKQRIVLMVTHRATSFEEFDRVVYMQPHGNV